MNEKGNNIDSSKAIYAYAKSMLKVMDDYANDKTALLEGIAILTTTACDMIEGSRIAPILLTSVIQYMGGIKTIDNLRDGCQMIVDEFDKFEKEKNHIIGMTKYMADMLFEQGIHIDASDLKNNE